MRSDRGFEKLTTAVEVSCSWCDESVPLPAGDHSAVCIRCGTVMFRGLKGGMAGSFDEMESRLAAEGKRVAVTATPA